jgi:hypothetical protein
MSFLASAVGLPQLEFNQVRRFGIVLLGASGQTDMCGAECLHLVVKDCAPLDLVVEGQIKHSDRYLFLI